MTGLDEFRAALRAPAPATGRPVALDEIVRRGRRLRARRRLIGGVAWFTAFSVVVLGGAVLWEKTSYQGAAPFGAASADRTPGLPAGAWGEPVETGLTQPGGQIVLMLSFTKRSGMASVGCFEAADRSLSGCRTVWDLPDRTYATGFHALHAPVTVDGRGGLPIFGYFIGPARTITAKSGGRTVTAQLAVWSENADYKLFWFPSDQVSPTAKLTDWAAFQADGRPVPTGHARLDPPHD
jgi:hypothetical protein